jgi:F-type H+-transporting ATPase subunit epsilon
VTLRVALVVPDRELWSGEASTVIAKTTEGDIGVLTGRAPVFGILAEGSLVEIVTEESRVKAAVSGGFLSVADNKVSILAAQAQLGQDVDVEVARGELAAALAEASPAAEDTPEARYARALLRAAGDQA